MATTASTMPSSAHHAAAARQLAPAGTGAPYGSKNETYESASAEIKAIVRQLNMLATATTLEEHAAALKNFDDDVVFDTPFVQVQGRERVRILASLFKQLVGTLELEPKLVTITVPEGTVAKGGKLDIDGVLHLLPHRVWYLPATLLLPKDIPIYTTISLFIKAHNDMVYKVSGKNHNLPHVPRLLRIVAGYAAGLAVGIAEPAFNSLRDWYRAGVEQVSETNVTLREAAGNVVGTVRETAASALDTAGKAVERTTGIHTGATGTTPSSATTMGGSTTSYGGATGAGGLPATHGTGTTAAL